MCDVNDPRILNAYIAITEDEPTDWLILGYNDTRNTISLYATGTKGLSEFRDNIKNEILYGFVRVDDRFILITYVPDNVSGVRRARALVHSRSVASILELSHAQFTASSLSDLSDNNIRTRLKLGDHIVPNRPRPTSTVDRKRSSFANRRRQSTQYIPSPSPSPSPMSERNLAIHTEEPESFDDFHDRMMRVASPVTPTSTSSSVDEPTYRRDYFKDQKRNISPYMDDRRREELEKKKAEDNELMFKLQLQKKRELEEARFKQQKEIIPMQREIIPMQREIIPKQIPAEILPRIETEKRGSRRNTISYKEDTILSQSPIDIPPSVKEIAVENTVQKIAVENTVQKIAAENTIEKIVAVLKNEKRSSALDMSTPTIENKVLMTGFMSVQTNTIPYWKRRYFIIQNTNMLLYKDELSKIPVAVIDIKTVTRLAPADEDEDTYVPNSFFIDTHDDTFHMFADDKKTAKQIYTTLQSNLK
ncbi:hypothetical protein BDB01DRAFT_853499 [Pilobolus umbonatus]|nr:hypothetical protein BDB01DRAFT_853499 [Pilobolus umbonatus]